MPWCWYIEGGGSFYGGYATREAAIRAAYENGETIDSGLYVGTESDPMDAIAHMIDADSIAEQLGEDLNVEDCMVGLVPGAKAALQEWARSYLSCDASSVCLDGRPPTRDEWATAEAQR